MGLRMHTHRWRRLISALIARVQIVDKLKTLTLLEAAELVKEIETTFGVDARSVGMMRHALFLALEPSPSSEPHFASPPLICMCAHKSSFLHACVHSAAAPVAMMAGPAGGAAAAAPVVEEKTTFDVVLEEIPADKKVRAVW